MWGLNESKYILLKVIYFCCSCWKKKSLFAIRSQSFQLISQDFPSRTSWVKLVNLVPPELLMKQTELLESHKEIKCHELWTLLLFDIVCKCSMGTGGGGFQHRPKNTFKISQDWIVLYQKDVCLLYWEGMFVWFWAWILRLAHVAYVEVKSFGSTISISETHPFFQTNSTLDVSLIWS